jgi:hypothetical protein
VRRMVLPAGVEAAPVLAFAAKCRVLIRPQLMTSV